MKKFFALMALSLFGQNLQADPVNAPENSIWVKIESIQVFGNTQIDIVGYVEGSTVLSSYVLQETGSNSHCLKSLYLMMEKPGKYTTRINYYTCTLQVAK
jgi:hypothetical protein